MRIASGGMATVWVARLRGTRGFQKIVALKTILPTFSSNPIYERRFLEEARLAGRIRHPNVAQILDLGEDNGMLFLAMEWVDGVSLSELVRAAQSIGVAIPFCVAIRIATQVAAGLHAAHELRDDNDELIGLVHRDVSPQNILVSFDGVTKVVDFGMAKVTGANAVEAPRSVQLMGKAGYLAPEQIVDGPTDRGIDIFALGVVLYLLTAGVHPFEGSGAMATLYNISCHEPARPPSGFRSDYPKELESVVLRCLEKERSRRFATCDELVWALESSVPADLRATDQDVAVFVRSLAGDIGAERHGPLQLSSGDGDVPTTLSRPQTPHRDDFVPHTAVDGDGAVRRATLPDASPPAPARSGWSYYGAALWGAVLTASIWMLVLQARAFAGTFSTQGAPLPRTHAPASACPPPIAAGVSAELFLADASEISSNGPRRNRESDTRFEPSSAQPDVVAQPRPRRSTSKEPAPSGGPPKTRAKRKP